jgi:KDO2-lipid IV(A) lauroyltransferase
MQPLPSVDIRVSLQTQHIISYHMQTNDYQQDRISRAKGAIAAFILKTLGKLPFSIAQCLGAFIGWLTWLLPTTSKHVTAVNLNKCFPSQSIQWRRNAIRRSLIQTGITMIECATLWIRPFEWGKQFITSVDGEHLIEEAIARQRGILFITPHLGNWELLSQYIASRFQVTAMYRPSRLEAIDKIILHSRSEPGTIMAPTTIRGVKQIKDALLAGGTTVIFPDQVPHSKGGIDASFFGQNALTGVLVPRLLKNSEVVPLCIYSYRLGIGKGFQVRVRPVETDIKATDIAVATTALNRTIETVVKEAVYQYQWSYKRFKSTQDTQMTLYD